MANFLDGAVKSVGDVVFGEYKITNVPYYKLQRPTPHGEMTIRDTRVQMNISKIYHHIMKIHNLNVIDYAAWEQKERFKDLVIEELIKQYGIIPIEAANMVNNSVFAEMIDIDAGFAGHYSPEYWATDVIKEYEHKP